MKKLHSCCKPIKSVIAMKPYENTTLDDEIYKITKSDIKAIKNILKSTHSFTLVCMGEKQLPNNWKLFLISAPDTINSIYTGTGQSLATAVDKWFNRVEEAGRPHNRRNNQKGLGHMVKRIIPSSIRAYTTTLFSGVMIGFVLVHTAEDILLMSIGRFVPLPLLAMYGLGLITSWLVMGCLVNRLIKHKPHH